MNLHDVPTILISYLLLTQYLPHYLLLLIHTYSYLIVQGVNSSHNTARQVYKFMSSLESTPTQVDMLFQFNQWLLGAQRFHSFLATVFPVNHKNGTSTSNSPHISYYESNTPQPPETNQSPPHCDPIVKITDCTIPITYYLCHRGRRR